MGKGDFYWKEILFLDCENNAGFAPADAINRSASTEIKPLIFHNLEHSLFTLFVRDCELSFVFSQHKKKPKPLKTYTLC
jgi:hypothetical protein